MELDVRRIDARMALGEAAALGDIRCGRAVPLDHPSRGAEQGGQAAIAAVIADRFADPSDDVDVEMVLQIAADARQIGDDGQAESAQIVGRADPRQKQELWRVDRAGGDNDFTLGSGDRRRVADGVFDADRAIFLEDDAQRQSAGHDRQIGPPHRRPQIGARRAHSPPVLLRHLIDACAFLGGAVEIRIGRQACLDGRLDEPARQRIRS